MGLLTREEVDYFRTNHQEIANVSGSYGGMVLKKWVESTLTYRDLTDTLRENHLVTLAEEIEGFFAGTDV